MMLRALTACRSCCLLLEQALQFAEIARLLQHHHQLDAGFLAVQAVGKDDAQLFQLAAAPS